MGETTSTKLQQAVEQLWAKDHAEKLPDWVRSRRRAGHSWRTIARDLSDEIDLDLTDVTLSNWYGSSVSAVA